MRSSFVHLIAWLGLLLTGGVLLVSAVAPMFRGLAAIPQDLALGALRLRLYTLVVSIAFTACFLLGRKLFLSLNLTAAQISSLAIVIALGGVLGARFHDVIFSPYLRAHPTEAFFVWQGGLGIFGAIAGGSLAAYFWTLRQGVSFLPVLDGLALVLPLGQAIGRWGNFFNHEAFGYPTNLPWKMYVAPAFRPPEYAAIEFFHPTFLYESMWALLIFVLLWRVRGELFSSPGAAAGMYLMLYGVGRFFIEAVRLDSLLVGGVRIDQAFSLVAVLLGALLFARARKNRFFSHPI